MWLSLGSPLSLSGINMNALIYYIFLYLLIYF
jgi:hypothetical protein